MKHDFKITNIIAREILDSRSNPTVEAEVYTENAMGRAAVPSGASTGVFEAAQLRDGDPCRYCGNGVKTAVDNVNGKIAKQLINRNVLDQRGIDKLLCMLDSTPNKEVLGANAILAVSLAAASAAANSLGVPLYRYIGGSNAHVLPIPMMNIINGGVHADNNIDIQEFMIMPVGASCFSAGLRMCSEVYRALKTLLSEKDCCTAVGDEGGFAPNLANDEEAFCLILDAVEKAGYKAGSDFMLAVDAAASGWYCSGGTYKAPKSGMMYDSDTLAAYWTYLSGKYPLYSIEDGAAEDDWDTWKKLTNSLGSGVRLVGDDLFVTNSERLKRGIRENAANAVLIKPNQIGTLTETLDTVRVAQSSGYTAILSHRSGDTEDSIIADIAVAVNCGFIKSGAPCRSERTAKYNQLLRIEGELAKNGKYGV